MKKKVMRTPAVVLLGICAMWMGTAAVSAQSASGGASGPRVGKYKIYSYGATGATPLFLGHFELMPEGKYRVSRTSGAPYYGDGTYRFNAEKSTIEWLTGPYATPEWGGKFSVDGARHRVELRSRTIATNSE